MTRVLVIEDEKAVLENIEELLEAEGFTVFTAANGKIGVDKALELLPDFIISDIMMPIMSGDQVVEILRNNSNTAHIPFIFLSAKSEVRDILEGMLSGADGFLTKPFTPDDLFDSIRTILSKHTKIKEPIQAILNKFRQDIAVIIPHELRTPLNGIKMTVQLLLSSLDTMEPDEMKQFLEMVLQSSNRIESLIKKFELYIELERIEMGDENILKDSTPRTIEPISIIESLAANISLNYGRESDLHLEIKDFELPVYHKHFESLVHELIDNAFKFSEPGKMVKVTLGIIDGKKRFIVYNEGIGLSKNKLNNLGELQYNRKLMEQQGLGLGLAIVKRIMSINKLSSYADSRLDQYFKYEVVFP